MCSSAVAVTRAMSRGCGSTQPRQTTGSRG
jgi:hypothetical protein